MDDRWRIRLGMLALVLVAACGLREKPDDAGVDGSGATGVAGAGGRAGSGGAGGRGGTGGRAGTFGPGSAGSPAGAGGSGGSGGAGGRGGTGGTAGIGGAGGRGGVGGSGGVSGRGGGGGTAGTGGTGAVGGVGGVAGTFVTGRGGVAGTSDLAGRGGRGGIGGIGGIFGRGGTGGTAGTGGADCSTCWTAILPVEARALVYSAARNELYASVAGDAAAYQNTIVVVDPTTAAVRSAIPVGSNPGALALSDDGSTLWVAIEGAHAFRKVTMSATPPVVGPLIHLPKSHPAAYFDATSMAVLAGAPLSVVVVLSDGGYRTEVRVFDDGVPRATGVNVGNRSIVTAGPPGTAFGADREGPYFYVYTASPAGITATTNKVLLSTSFDTLAHVGARVFSGGGDAVDITNLAAPSWVGRLPYQGPVARRDAGSVLILANTSAPFPPTLRADVRIFSSVQLAELGAAPLPDSVGPTTGSYSDLVYAGADAAALIRHSFTPSGRATVVILHNPALGPSIGGGGGASGTGGGAGTGGAGGAPDPCPGCTFTTVQAYGRDMVHDPSRNLIYVASNAGAPVHPSTIVAVNAATGAVASFVPVGNDPQSLGLSDDGSALWVGLVGERRVRRMTPGATPVPGPAYSLPMLLTTGETSVPQSIAVLPGTPSSIAVGVQGMGGSYPYYGRRGVFILDDGQPRANFVQPPEVGVSFLTNGPPGYLLGVGDTGNLIVLRLGTVGATLESHGGLFGVYNNPTDLHYSAGAAYASAGEVIDLSNPDAPLPAGRFFAGGDCAVASRSATRVMMLCPNYAPGGTLLMLDNTTFTRVGSVALPNEQYAESGMKFLYLGGDAVAFLGQYGPLRIMRAPLIGSPP